MSSLVKGPKDRRATRAWIEQWHPGPVGRRTVSVRVPSKTGWPFPLWFDIPESWIVAQDVGTRAEATSKLNRRELQQRADFEHFEAEWREGKPEARIVQGAENPVKSAKLGGRSGKTTDLLTGRTRKT